jgi:hypothetical protein
MNPFFLTNFPWLDCAVVLQQSCKTSRLNLKYYTTTQYSYTLLYFIHSTLFLRELSSKFPFGRYRHHLESISIALSSKLDIIWNQYSISHSGEEKKI